MGRLINAMHRRPRLFFQHLPKCDGTSIHRAIRKQYLLPDPRRDSEIVRIDNIAAKQTVDDPAFRKLLLQYYMNQKHIRYISGHVPFVYHQDFAYVTLVRDPVDRFLSEYNYNKTKRKSTHHRHDMGIEEYIDSEYGQAQGTQYQRFIGDNLGRFTVVGILENLDAFVSAMRDKLGIKLNIGRYNVTSSKEMISPEITKRIEVICEPDYEIYNKCLHSNVHDDDEWPRIPSTWLRPV